MGGGRESPHSAANESWGGRRGGSAGFRKESAASKMRNPGKDTTEEKRKLEMSGCINWRKGTIFKRQPHYGEEIVGG